MGGVVGVGGGSSMDAAKITAFLCGNTRQVFKKSATSAFDHAVKVTFEVIKRRLMVFADLVMKAL